MYIVIDCGHSKKTAGKRSPDGKFLEYKQNRILGKMIGDRLTSMGIDWCFTYNTDDENDLGLGKRAAVANEKCKIYGAKNVLLLSIHHNAIGDGKSFNNTKGFSVWTTKGKTTSDKYGELFVQAAEEVLVPMGRKVIKDRSDGDGDYEQNFTVIFKTLCPSVLIEYGFYTNEEEMEWMMSEEGLNAFVELTIRAIEEINKGLK